MRARRPMEARMVKSLIGSIVITLLAASCSLPTSAPPTRAEVAGQLDRLAVPFVANAGQSDPRVAYSASTFSGTVFVTREGDVVYALPAHRAAPDASESASGWTLTERFVDGHATPVGAHAAATHVNVFAGNDPARWQRDVASYADVE